MDIAMPNPIAMPPAFANCSIVTIDAKLLEVNGACCANQACAGLTRNFTCGVGCAATLLPFFDACKPALDTIFDVAAEDKTVDGHAGALSNVARRNCVAASSMLLVVSIARMEADGCDLNMEGTVANGTMPAAASGGGTRPSTIAKPACHDDDAGN